MNMVVICIKSHVDTASKLCRANYNVSHACMRITNTCTVTGCAFRYESKDVLPHSNPPLHIILL